MIVPGEHYHHLRQEKDSFRCYQDEDDLGTIGSSILESSSTTITTAFTALGGSYDDVSGDTSDCDYDPLSLPTTIVTIDTPVITIGASAPLHPPPTLLRDTLSRDYHHLGDDHRKEHRVSDPGLAWLLNPLIDAPPRPPPRAPQLSFINSFPDLEWEESEVSEDGSHQDCNYYTPSRSPCFHHRERKQHY